MFPLQCSARGGEDQDLGGLLTRLSALVLLHEILHFFS